MTNTTNQPAAGRQALLHALRTEMGFAPAGMNTAPIAFAAIDTLSRDGCIDLMDWVIDEALDLIATIYSTPTSPEPETFGVVLRKPTGADFAEAVPIEIEKDQALVLYSEYLDGYLKADRHGELVLIKGMPTADLIAATRRAAARLRKKARTASLPTTTWGHLQFWRPQYDFAVVTNFH